MLFADDSITKNHVIMAAIQAVVTIVLTLSGIITAYISLRRELRTNTASTQQTQESVTKTQEAVARTEVAISKAAANTIVAAKMARDASVKTDSAMADLHEKINENEKRIESILKGDSDPKPTS